MYSAEILWLMVMYRAELSCSVRSIRVLLLLLNKL
jgi:hypothetical protein